MFYNSRRPKYGNTKCLINGNKFDSKAEASYYLYLLDCEKKNNLKIISLQPKVYLSKAKILYKPDFLIEQNGELIYIDVKGFSTAVFNLKKRLWEHYAEKDLHVVSSKSTEVIKPIFAIVRKLNDL